MTNAKAIGAHTQTPWKVHFAPAEKYTPTLTGANQYDRDYIAIVSTLGPGEDGEGVVADNASYYPQPITEANAAYIVQAVNSHAALVSFVQAYLDGGSTENLVPQAKVLLASHKDGI